MKDAATLSMSKQPYINKYHTMFMQFSLVMYIEYLTEVALWTLQKCTPRPTQQGIPPLPGNLTEYANEPDINNLLIYRTKASYCKR